MGDNGVEGRGGRGDLGREIVVVVGCLTTVVVVVRVSNLDQDHIALGLVFFKLMICSGIFVEV